MSQNKPNNPNSTPSGTPNSTTDVGPGTGHSTSSGSTTDTTLQPIGGQGGATATGTAPAREGIAATAQEYGQKIADAASTAKDYMSDKVSVVGDRLKDLQNKDYKQVADDAKAYARENPGQALLISAAAGFMLGLLLRGSRR